MATASGAPTGPGFTSPDLTYRPPIQPDGAMDESAIASPQLGTRAVEVVNPSHEEPNYLYNLPTALFARMCYWLDHASIARFANASRQCLLGVMGLRAAQGLLAPGAVTSLIGELPATPFAGYELRGRIVQLEAFSIGNFQDLLDKGKLIPEWNLLPEEFKARFERTFAAFKDALFKELTKCKELQGADFSRVFNLITSGEMDVSFSRPATGLTDAQKQKVVEIQNAYRRLNDLFIALVQRFTQIGPRMAAVGGPNQAPAAMKAAFTEIVNSIKEAGNLQVENSEIEKALLQNLPFLLNEMPIPPRQTPENIAAVKEALTYLITELFRFESAKLTPDERLQLAATLHETFDIVKPLFGISVKLIFEQMKAAAEAPLRALQPAGQIIRPPNSMRHLVREIIFGINAAAIASVATPILLDQLPVVLPHSEYGIYTFGMGIAAFIGLNCLRPYLSFTRPATGFRAIGSLLTSFALSLLVASQTPYSPIGMCGRPDPSDSIRSFTGDMRLLDNDSLVLAVFLVWLGLTMLAFED